MGDEWMVELGYSAESELFGGLLYPAPVSGSTLSAPLSGPNHRPLCIYLAEWPNPNLMELGHWHIDAEDHPSGPSRKRLIHPAFFSYVTTDLFWNQSPARIRQQLNLAAVSQWTSIEIPGVRTLSAYLVLDSTGKQVQDWAERTRLWHKLRPWYQQRCKTHSPSPCTPQC